MSNYSAVAEILKNEGHAAYDAISFGDGPGEARQIERIIAKLANNFASLDPTFDVARFTVECLCPCDTCRMYRKN